MLTKLNILRKNQTNINSNTNCANFNINTKPSYYKPNIYQSTTRFAAILFTITATTLLLFSLLFTATGIHLEPIDMLYAGKQRPLNEKGKKRWNKLCLCRYCGQPNHMAKNHNDASKLQAKHCAANIHKIIMALPSENMPFPSIVALKDLLDYDHYISQCSHCQHKKQCNHIVLPYTIASKEPLFKIIAMVDCGANELFIYYLFTQLHVLKFISIQHSCDFIIADGKIVFLGAIMHTICIVFTLGAHCMSWI